jgi:two-component system sensor histidine kinase KdpD
MGEWMKQTRRAPTDARSRRDSPTPRRARGKLKIFFGAAPGVGKTFAMLEAALRAREQGADVVVGVVETHGRADTRALLEGIEAVAPSAIRGGTETAAELDLDAALGRHPELVILDDLAHTNAPGLRHPKRWQDAMELLDAGIDVWTTLNVEHLESLNGVVSQITHLRVHETVPDAVFDRADEVELVDRPPDALLERLEQRRTPAGGPAAARAEARFFRKGNLLALRELALRRTAERVDTDVLAYRREHGISATWPVTEHILVCVGPSPASADLVRAACRMASGLRARWTAACVETAPGRSSSADRARVARHLRLAEELGAQVTTLGGHRPAEEIVAYARTHNITRIVMGKPTHAHVRDVLFGSLLDEVVRGSGDIDVHVIRGDRSDESRDKSALTESRAARLRGAAYAWSVLVVGIATVAALAMFRRFDLANLVMVYLLGIVFVAYRFGRGPATFASALSVAAFDFCFVPPYFRLTVADATHVVTFAIMLLVGLVVSGLTERVRQQAAAARQRAQRTGVLYALTRELAGSVDLAQLADVAVRHIVAVFDGNAVVLLGDGANGLTAIPVASAALEIDEPERRAATWALSHGEAAGLETATLPGARALYLPLRSASRTLGLLGIRPADPERLRDPEQRQMLEALCQPVAMALERVVLAGEAEAAHRRAEREEVLSSLLSSVSHDLRTPLAAMTGAASTLLEHETTADVRRDLLQTIFEEADRMNRLVGNLLDMTRLETGGLRLHKEWTPLEELIGAALNRLDALLRGRDVRVRLPADLPLLPVDNPLIVQAFVNLLENAAKYTPTGGPIEIDARAVPRADAAGQGLSTDPEGASTLHAGSVEVAVSDRGPGLPSGTEERIFDKFFRARSEGSPPGTGLGLAIVRGIVKAHGGSIVAENRPGGGTVFRMVLPLDGLPPVVPAEGASPTSASAGEPKAVHGDAAPLAVS